MGAAAGALIGSVSSGVLHRAGLPAVVVPVHEWCSDHYAAAEKSVVLHGRFGASTDVDRRVLFETGLPTSKGG
jgi:hypothetical protein